VTIPDTGDVSVFFDARLQEHWTLVDGMVEVHDAHVELHVQGDAVDGFFAGALRFGEHGEVEVPIAVARSAESATWTLRLACSGRDVGGAAALTPLPRGVSLPRDLPALELSEFTVVFGEARETRRTEVQSMVLKAALKEAWTPPGLTEFDVRDARLDVTIANPADPHPRVNAALALTVDVANVHVPMAATWQTG
jgi:hypothetical protein